MPKLKRSISWLQGTAMAIGAVIGTGVLILPAKTAELAGPASLVSWILISVFVLPIALTLGRLAAKVPDAGGIVAYARKAFGPSIAKNNRLGSSWFNPCRGSDHCTYRGKLC